MFSRCHFAETQFKQLEQQIQEQIDELLSFKLDDTLIQQLETKSRNNLMKSYKKKEGRYHDK